MKNGAGVGRRLPIMSLGPMHSDDTLRKLALPLALVAAFLASSASTHLGPFHAGPTLRAPTLDIQTLARWHEAYLAASPLLHLGN